MFKKLLKSHQPKKELEKKPYPNTLTCKEFEEVVKTSEPYKGELYWGHEN